ncbi:spherical body protein 2 truncated copy 9, putative [Babesia ovis]|uniref:Spherical body protein 2 truncated copy 9, putative n=1 Tax=Babesia ovis TaxID=5869 RepID=A0A9W5TB32_BABOV|nr:spherical body protein 2 truncated copy 9, putative [Babesia ovis]
MKSTSGRNNGFRKVAKWVLGVAAVAGVASGNVLANEAAETPEPTAVEQPSVVEQPAAEPVSENPPAADVTEKESPSKEPMDKQTPVPQPADKAVRDMSPSVEGTNGGTAFRGAGDEPSHLGPLDPNNLFKKSANPWDNIKRKDWYVDTIKDSNEPLPDLLTFHQRYPLESELKPLMLP